MHDNLICRWGPLVTLFSALVGLCLLNAFTQAFYMRLCCWSILTGISLASLLAKPKRKTPAQLYGAALTSLLVAAFLLIAFGSPLLAFSGAIAGYHRPITGLLLPILLAIGQITGVPPIFGMFASAVITLVHDVLILLHAKAKTQVITSTGAGADGLVSIFDVWEGNVDANSLG